METVTFTAEGFEIMQKAVLALLNHSVNMEERLQMAERKIKDLDVLFDVLNEMEKAHKRDVKNIIEMIYKTYAPKAYEQLKTNPAFNPSPSSNR